MSIIIGGTIAIDNVSTPTSSAGNLLGGSASYASLAASYYCKPTYLVGVVGHDFPQEHLEMLSQRGVDLSGVEYSKGESFTWTGEYHENMNERTTHSVGLNVLEDWKVKIPAEIASSRIVVLANMSPDNQLQMIDQCTNDDKFVIADTMDLWIQIANDQLHTVLDRIDLLVLNESEARLLADENNLIVAGEVLLKKGPDYVVIKLGEFGAILFTSNNELYRFHAWPLREIIDPTGAGDTFLGAMAGYLASLKNVEGADFSDEQIKAGLIRGGVLASFTCEDFSTKKMQGLSLSDINKRMENLLLMSQ
ncbi:MAG: PfkB family carbohydrate kinase [Akkermansiaceae bacterium]